jgi:hypothetical protein
VKTHTYNIPTPDIHLNGNLAKEGEGFKVQKEPVMPKEEFYNWLSQHIHFHTEAYKAIEHVEGYNEEKIEGNFVVVQPRNFPRAEHICGSCGLKISYRRPFFSLPSGLKAFPESDSDLVCLNCFPQLIEESCKTRKQLRDLIEVVDDTE